MLAFEFGGGWGDVKGSVAVTVLQFLLGGGGSFSAGGPGALLLPPTRRPSRKCWMHRPLRESSACMIAGLWSAFTLLASCITTA